MKNNNTDLSSLKIDRTGQKNKSTAGRKAAVTITLLAAVILLYAGYLLISSYFDSTVEVNLVTAALQPPSGANAVLTASGYVVAQRKAAVASKGTGRLVYLGVVEGDKVKKNQIIARLEDSDVEAQLAEAKANLELQQAGLKDAQNTYDREKALFKTNSASQSEVDAAEANYKKVLASIDIAKANIRAAKVAIENTIIRAPFDGTVLTKNADVGEIVAPLAAGVNSRAAVVTIADMKSLQVETDVSESNIEKISPGQNCQIILDAYPGRSYAGYVAKIVPTADRTKATVLVKVGFKNYDKRVLPEMSAKVLFLSDRSKKASIDRQPVLVLPSSAVAERAGRQVVFIVKNNKAVSVDITEGKRFDSLVEIKSGVKNGQQVIGNVTEKIKNGEKVKVQ